MSAKRYELPVSESVAIIRRARAKLERMPRERQIDIMVKAGVMTEEQAARAKKAIAEREAAK